jgi:hypothetical protein
VGAVSAPRDLGAPKATQVLELLLVARGHNVTKDRLADQLWREFVTRITRLRCTYDQLVPELAPLMSQAVADDGVVDAQPQVAAVPEGCSASDSVVVITSVVVGGDGVIVFGVNRLLDLAIAVGAAAGALAPGWASWYRWRQWCQASRPPSRDVPAAVPLARTSDRCHELAPRTSSPGCCGLRASPVDMGSLAAGSRVQ